MKQLINQPKEITNALLGVVVMPNGEVICLGKTVGWFKDLGPYLYRTEEGESK
jgi:hypothetical protein